MMDIGISSAPPGADLVAIGKGGRSAKQDDSDGKGFLDALTSSLGNGRKSDTAAKGDADTADAATGTDTKTDADKVKGSAGDPTAIAPAEDDSTNTVSGMIDPSATNIANLAELAKGQRPYATIVGCSDSRVPPELVFDAAFGELFIVRVAGNVISPEVMGTLQYAVVHLHTQLLVVLGHEGCGAVEAALAVKSQGVRERARIALLLDRILPGLQGIDAELTPQDQLEAAVEANVRWSMHQLLDTPEGKARMAEGVVKLVGAVYQLKTGRVRFLL